MAEKKEEEKELIPKEEIEKLRAETEKQLNYAKSQVILWNKKMEQLTGSLAMCDVILSKTEQEKAKE